jgi:hypothetical protein
MLEPEVTRLMPGCTGLLLKTVSSRDDKRVRCSCWLIPLMEAWRGGDARYGLKSPVVGRFIARNEGLAPGWRLEFRSGDPTCPNADCPGSEPDSKLLSYVGPRGFPHIDWKREGDAAAAPGDPYLRSDAVGETPSLDWEALSLWSREKRRSFSWGVSRSLSEFGSRSSSNFPTMSVSSLYVGRAPTLEDIIPRERLAASSECNILLPTGCSTDSGGDEPNAAMPLPRRPSPNAESCRFRRAGESAW